MQNTFYKSGDKVIFKNLEMSKEEWAQVDIPNIYHFNGETAEIDSVDMVMHDSNGDRNYEYYNIKFPNNIKFFGISGYHLLPPPVKPPTKEDQETRKWVDRIFMTQDQRIINIFHQCSIKILSEEYPMTYLIEPLDPTKIEPLKLFKSKDISGSIYMEIDDMWITLYVTGVFRIRGFQICLEEHDDQELYEIIYELFTFLKGNHPTQSPE